MNEKIREWLNKALEKIPRLSYSSAAMKYISWYAVFLMLCSGIYVVMILYDWYSTGRANVAEMRQFISVMLSGAAVAAIGFIARYMVDKDGNGIPDEIEKGDSNDIRRNPRRSGE